MTRKIIFLDRDGVINHEVGYLHKISDFKFIDKDFSSFIYLKKKGFSFIVVTNQSGIARGIYNIDKYHHLNNWMINEFKKRGIDILDTFFCPHSPDDGCKCRKPKPGMLISAMEKHSIDRDNSWMIGDKEIDITAARESGIYKTILVRSGHDIDETLTNASFVINSIENIKEIIY